MNLILKSNFTDVVLVCQGLRNDNHDTKHGRKQMELYVFGDSRHGKALRPVASDQKTY